MKSILTKINEKFKDLLFGNDIEDIYDDGQSISENEYHRLKAELQKNEKRRKSKAILFYFLSISLLASLSFFSFIFHEIPVEDGLSGINISKLAPCFLVSIFVGLFVGSFGISLYNITFESRTTTLQSKIYEYELSNAKEEAEEDIFKNSIKMSSKYLDQYYLQTKQQAQKGFFITVCVAIFGAGLIAVGIVAMFIGKVEPSYVTCASGVITEFIAAIFFYLYNRTVSSMSKYHNKLVLAQNVSIALKVSDSLSGEDSAEAKKQIITELLKDMNDHLIKDDPPTKFGK